MSVASKASSDVKKPPRKTNRVMQFYLARRKEHEEFIAKERSEFELGKKHLANMMGMEAGAMTQEDIDQAIKYLFPSGLEEPGARPVMKPPEEIFPAQKAQEFDYSGRPVHPFFFTKKPQYTQSLYTLAEHINNIGSFGEKMHSLRVPPNPEEIIDSNMLTNSRWMNYKELSKLFIEDVDVEDQKNLVVALERLVELPFSYKVKDFIFKYVFELRNRQRSPTCFLQIQGQFRRRY